MRRPVAVLVGALAAVVVLATTATAVTLAVRYEGTGYHSHAMMRGDVAGDEFSYLTRMVAHHEEAVDAARQLARSDRPRMRAFGRDIVATQSAQVEQMRAWLAA